MKPFLKFVAKNIVFRPAVAYLAMKGAQTIAEESRKKTELQQSAE